MIQSEHFPTASPPLTNEPLPATFPGKNEVPLASPRLDSRVATVTNKEEDLCSAEVKFSFSQLSSEKQ